MVSVVTQPLPPPAPWGWWLLVAPGLEAACPLEPEANLWPRPHAGCRVESIYLNVESVSTHRERSEVSAPRIPIPASIPGDTLRSDRAGGCELRGGPHVALPVTTNLGPLALGSCWSSLSAGLCDFLPCFSFSSVCPALSCMWLLGIFFFFLSVLPLPPHFDVTQEVGIKAEDTFRSCKHNRSTASVFSFGAAETPLTF